MIGESTKMDLSILNKFSKEEILKIINALDITTENNKKQTEPVLIREIEPIERWVNNPYYTGKDGLKLFQFWKDVLIEIFGTHKGQYNEIIIEGGLGCRPLDSYINTSIGKVTYNQLLALPKNKLKNIFISSDVGTLPIESINTVGKKQTVIVKFQDGYNLVCTENHKIRVLRNNEITWLEAKDLKQQDVVLRSYKKDTAMYKTTKSTKKDVCYFYVLGTILFSSVYRKKDKLISVTKIKDNSTKTKLINCLTYLKLGYHVYKKTINFDATCFEQELTNIGIKFNRECSFNCSLFNSGVFKKKLLKLDNINNFICAIIDNGEYITRDDVVGRIAFNSERLAREVQSIFFSLGIPCELYLTTKTTKRYASSIRDFSLSSQSNIEKYKFKTFINFTDHLAVKSLSKLNISNEKFKTYLKHKLFNFEHGRLNNVDMPINTGGLFSLKDRLNDYCERNNIKTTKIQDSIRKRKYFHICLLDYFKNDNVENFDFDDDVLSYCFSNSILTSRVACVQKGFELECGDITVKGNPVYINDSIVNHNCGKSTVGMYILIRKLYELSCYKNIPALFGLMASANIVFMYFSLTKYQAELTGFKQFRETVDNIPYFQELFCRNMRHSSILEFPENVVFRHGARLTDQIGSNLIATIMDEANFFNHEGKATADAGALSAIQTLHTSVLNRGASRFMADGVNSSISVLISSPTYSSSYTQQRIEASIGNPHARVFRCRLWDCKPDKYSKEYFNVFLGNEKVDPFIIRDIEDLNNALEAESCPKYTGKSLKEGIETMPPRMREKIDFIPIDFKDRFETDLLQSIMDIAGYSVAPTGRLFSSRKIWNKCISDNVPILFTKNIMTITTEDDSAFNTMEYYLKDKTIFPDRHLSHYIHIDQSYAHDSTGFAICHRGESVLKNGSFMPTIILDCAIRITPPPAPKKISIARVRSFIFYCINNLKLNIAKVTYDSFSSAESIQTLKENGVNAEMQSVDRTDDAYLGFIDLLYDERITFNKVDAELMATEIFDLVHYRERHKVDHQPNGCFSGNTKIKVIGEGCITIKELVGRTDVKTYGANENNDIIEVNITKIWKVKSEDKISKIRILNMDDGQITEIVCTRNHLFRLKNKSYLEASKLELGMSLCGVGKFIVAGVLNYTLATPIDVYDMESPETSNYCLGNGIIVHNSKDVMDAVVGCVYSAVKDKECEIQTPQQLSAGLRGNFDNYINDEDVFSNEELLYDYYGNTK